MLFDKVSVLIMEAGNPPYRCVSSTEKPVVMANLSGAVIAIMRGQRTHAERVRTINPQTDNDVRNYCGDTVDESEERSTRPAMPSMAARAVRSERHRPRQAVADVFRYQQPVEELQRRTGGFEGMPFEFDTHVQTNVLSEPVELLLLQLRTLENQLSNNSIGFEPQLLAGIRPKLIMVLQQNNASVNALCKIYESLRAIKFRGQASQHPAFDREVLTSLEVCSIAVATHLALGTNEVRAAKSRVSVMLTTRKRYLQGQRDDTPVSSSNYGQLEVMITYIDQMLRTLRETVDANATTYTMWLFNVAQAMVNGNNNIMVSIGRALTMWGISFTSHYGEQRDYRAASGYAAAVKAMTTLFCMHDSIMLQSRNGFGLWIDGDATDTLGHISSSLNALVASFMLRMKADILSNVVVGITSVQSIERVEWRIEQLLAFQHVSNFLKSVIAQGDRTEYARIVIQYLNDAALLSREELTGCTITTQSR